MPTPAARLLTLIQLLQRQPEQKAADLAESLGVSVRTVHRYFGMLDEMGVPVYAERGPHGGFSLVRGYKLPPLVFSPEEAVAVALGANLMERLWGRLYLEAARSALAKLENVLPDDARQEIAWAQRSLAAAGLSRDDIEQVAPSLRALRQALRDSRVVRIVYHSYSHSEGEAREVEPYGLAHASGWWYLIGYCRLRQGLRTFRVDRIAGLEPTGEGFTPPPGFDLHAYIAEMQRFAPQVQVRLRFFAQYADLAQLGRGYWSEMAQQPDGSVLATFNAPDVNAAASNVLAYGPAVEVLAPDEVRRTVRAWAQATATLYQDKED